MKKILIGIGVVIALAIAYVLASPLFIDKVISEDSPVQSLEYGDVEVVRTGEFFGFDRVHVGSGTVNLIKTKTGFVVRMEESFSVTNGPDLFVGLGKDGVYREEAQIAPLRGNIGSQNYMVPNTVNVDEYNEIWIWCRAFSVPFARAVLN